MNRGRLVPIDPVVPGGEYSRSGSSSFTQLLRLDVAENLATALDFDLAVADRS